MVVIFKIYYLSVAWALVFVSLYTFHCLNRWIDIFHISSNGRYWFRNIFLAVSVIFIFPQVTQGITGLDGILLFSPWFKMFYIFPAHMWHFTNLGFSTLMFLLFAFRFPFKVLRFLYIKWNRMLSRKRSDVELFVQFLRHFQIPLINQLKFQDALKRLSIGCYLFFLVSVIGGVLVSEYYYRIVTVPIVSKNLPKEISGFRITLISDIHFGQFMDEQKFKKFVPIINSLQSDVILIAGDIINKSMDEVAMAQRAMKGLIAQKGVYAVVGNHDQLVSEDLLIKPLEQNGIQFLRNESKALFYHGKQIALFGIDFPSKLYAIVDRKLAQSSIEKSMKNQKNYDFSILLTHTPDVFDLAIDNNIDLTLAGHTHASQISLGRIGSYDISPAQLVFRYVRGLYKKGQKFLYVNIGLGHWIPFRFNTSPEITQLILFADDESQPSAIGQ